MPLKIETLMTKQDVITGFTCDDCYTEFTKEDHPEQIQEMLHIDIEGGFGSPWGDGTKASVTVCQDCAYELLSHIANVKHPVD